MTTQRHPLAYYLALEYPYTVKPDDGSYFIEFPDLPGCMTQVEDPAEIAALAEEIRTLWIEGEYEDGATIPEPVTKEYSGKFVLRVPKSLHRDLAERAEREGCSLNAYVTYRLSGYQNEPYVGRNTGNERAVANPLSEGAHQPRSFQGDEGPYGQRQSTRRPHLTVVKVNVA
jgi:predicted RNase H-like HicB family nuclease